MMASLRPAAVNPQDYGRIAQAIAFLQENHQHQPDLATVARQVHLSESHLQRLFTRWAGISPKRFLQYLTVEYAKAQIAETRNLLELSLRSGLSSPSRLHGLFIHLEAMSPGEYRAGGQGLAIRYGLHGTPFGEVLVVVTQRGVCHLQFLAGTDAATAVAELRQSWPQADWREDPAATQPVCDRLVPPLYPVPQPPLTLRVKGTNFQIQVWRSLLRLPLGGLVTYQDVANQIGRPTATRAVANAIGQNPVAYLIPCHRVIRASGALGGYRWGLSQKAALLGWEASQLAQRGDRSAL